MPLDPITLGRRLREARENRRLTQEQAAQAVGISRTALVHIESGKRSLSTLELSELTKLYHRSVADFFAEEEQQVNQEDDPLLIIHRLPVELADDPEVKPSGVPLRGTLLHRRRTGDHPQHPRPDKPTRLRTSSTVPSVRRDPPGRASGGGGATAARLGYGPIADMADLITTQGVWASGVRGSTKRDVGHLSSALLDWARHPRQLRPPKKPQAVLVRPRVRPRPPRPKDDECHREQQGELSGVHRASGERLRRRLFAPRRGREMVPRTLGEGGSESPLPHHLHVGRGRARRSGRPTSTGVPADYVSGRRVVGPPLRRELSRRCLPTERPRIHQRGGEEEPLGRGRPSALGSSVRWTTSTTSEQRPGNRTGNSWAKLFGLPSRHTAARRFLRGGFAI